MILRRLVPLVVAVISGAALGAASADAATSAPRGCATLHTGRNLPAIRALDPRPRAPRVFAIQYRQAAGNVTSLGSFRTTIDCLVRRYVLPYRARGRPNVVVFDEDTGLATLAVGSRGAEARRLFSPQLGSDCGGPPCRALQALTMLGSAYAGPLGVYQRRFPGLGPLSGVFVAETDTIVRSFMATFSSLAERYGLYMIASGDLPAFRQSRDRRDVRLFGDPKLRARSAYVAVSSQVHNQAFIWGPREVRHRGPDVLRNVVTSNLKVPLTGIELGLGLVPGPGHGRAAVSNLRPYSLPGTSARLGIATSLPAFTYGAPPRGVNPCSDTSSYYMRCLDRLGANVVIQDEANPGSWSGPDGNGIEKWQPLSWMGSTYRAVSDPSVHFAYNVTAMLVGNLGDLSFDGQSAIAQRGGTRGPACHYVGNGTFVPADDQPILRSYAGAKRDFLDLAPWVVPDGPRSTLRRVGAELASGSGSRRQDDYLQTALVSDLPLPVDRHRAGCA